ncbi:MAG: anthranilate synthase component I [Elusimicrobiota bacterium]|nr:anthranilate synthase component I [Elusimicrobiota bacterium]
MFYPDLKKFIRLAKKYNLVPIYREIITDCDTPVSAFLKLTLNSKYSFLLESVVGGEHWGRYSFISWNPQFIFKTKNNRYHLLNSRNVLMKECETENGFEELKKLVKKYNPAEVPGLPRFWGGAVGFIGYEMVHNFENIPQLPATYPQLDDAIFIFTDMIVIFDHLTHRTKVVATILPDAKRLKEQYVQTCKKINNVISQLTNKNLQGKFNLNTTKTKKIPSKVKSNITKQEFVNKVKIVKEYIRAGDIIQVVLSQRFAKTTKAHPFDIYRCLRLVNPSPYMYYLNFDSFQLIGSSPEILVRKVGEVAETRPIAGTRPRGKTEVNEKKYERELLQSPKEKAEHIMLLDLGRNDLGRVCKYATIKIPEMMIIEKYSHVIHLVSSVIGKLKNNRDCFDLFRACFPAGTVTGAPKIRAMEIIAELEKNTRGPYAGAVGYFSYSGNMDMAITIRTILFYKNTAYVQAGAGIVADSNPYREYIETKNKAKALFQAIELAEREKSYLKKSNPTGSYY